MKRNSTEFRHGNSIPDGERHTFARSATVVPEHDLAESRAESGTQHVSLLQRDPPTSPTLRGPAIRWARLTCAPLHFEIRIQGSQLKEVAFVNLRLRWPEVIPLDPQRADDTSLEVCLLKYLAHCRGLWHLPVLDSACRNLDSHDLKRDVVMAEDQEPVVAHDETDDLPHEAAVRSDRHALAKGSMAATLSTNDRHTIRSS